MCYSMPMPQSNGTYLQSTICIFPNDYLQEAVIYVLKHLINNNSWFWFLIIIMQTKLYDKRDDFNFAIVNFPFICSNITTAPAYAVYISQLMRYSRACGSYQDFFDRGLLLTRKLLNQWFLLVKLKSSLRRFYCRHHDLVDRYGHFPVLSSFITFHWICN